MSKEVEEKEVAVGSVGNDSVEKTTEYKSVEASEFEVAKDKKEAKQATPKKLTLAELKKQDKKLDERKSVVVNIGEDEYTIEYDMIFRKTKQTKVMNDMMRLFQVIGTGQEDESVEKLEFASAYTALLIIKHFTSLDVSDDIDEALAMLQVLIDLGALGDIVKALPEDEVLKIYDLLTNTVNAVRENMEQLDKEEELLELELENEEAQAMVDEHLEKIKEDDSEEVEVDGQ